MAFQDHYELFGISPIASESEVRAAYRRLVLYYHPDRNPNNPVAEAKFKKVTEAYQVLSDPKARAQYSVHYAIYQDSVRQNRIARAQSAVASEANFAPKRYSDREETSRDTSQSSGTSDFLKNAASSVWRLSSSQPQGAVAPILHDGDAWWGLALSATLSIVVANWMAHQIDRPSIWIWCTLPFPAAMFGNQLGALLRDKLKEYQDIPGWWEDWLPLLPLLLSWSGIATALLSVRYFGVPLSVSGSLAAAIGGAVAGFGSGSLARAFLSVADTKFRKVVGYAVGCSVATGVALLLCPIAVLVLHGLFFSTRFYDHLLISTLSGVIGGNIAMLRGAARKI